MKKGLIVGNNYPDTNIQLQGSVNDGHLINQILVDFKFDTITNLYDKQATYANIIDQLTKLVESNPEDMLVFYYSGHGSQVIDYNNDESDGLDEVLCPYDMTETSNYITDDQLKQIISKKHSQSKMIMIIDSCHSGSVVDSTFQLQPYVGTIHTIDTQFLQSDKLSSQLIENYDQPEIPNLIIITGCQPQQLGIETFIGDRVYGVATYVMNLILRSSDFNITYHQLVNQMTMVLNQYQLVQQPELDGDKSMFDQIFFS